MAFEDKKGIVVASPFKLQAEALLDVRQQVDTIAERDRLVTLKAATAGLRVFVKENSTSYVYNGEGWDKLASGEPYIHPIGDGNHHVPATGTTNNGKYLKAGATAGSEAWAQIQASEIAGLPSKLPNPSKLSISFPGEKLNKSYDGSVDTTIELNSDTLFGAYVSDMRCIVDNVTDDFTDKYVKILEFGPDNKNYDKPDNTKEFDSFSFIIYNSTSGLSQMYICTLGLCYRYMNNKRYFMLLNISITNIGTDFSYHYFPDIRIGTDGTDSSGKLNNSIQIYINTPPTDDSRSYEFYTVFIKYLTATKDIRDILTLYNYKDSNSFLTKQQAGMLKNITITHNSASIYDIFPSDLNIEQNEYSHLTVPSIYAMSGKLKEYSKTDHTHTAGQITGLPTKIPNPHAIKFTGAATGSYDGSSELTVNIPTSGTTDSALTIQMNGGTAEGTNKFTFNGSAAKNVNITPALIGAATSNHTHPASQITGLPTKLPNPQPLKFTGAATATYDGSGAVTVDIPTAQASPFALTVQLNGGTSEGTNKFTFNGGSAKTINITPASIGAALSVHNHNAFKGASASATGGTGFVPAPAIGEQEKYLRGDGTWQPISLTLAALGITASATELNYMKGVTSSVQSQLNGKAPSSHTHNYAGSSSEGGPANSAKKVDFPVGTVLWTTSSSASFFSSTCGGTWEVMGNIDAIVNTSTTITLYMHKKTAL